MPYCRYLPFDVNGHMVETQPEPGFSTMPASGFSSIPTQVLKLPEQVLPNVVIKLKCPFCDSTYPSHNDFYIHLCDTHFKENLLAGLPSSPPYQCPVLGCSFVASKCQQNLVYHYGITHKVVFSLLKDHVNKTIFQLPPEQQQQIGQYYQKNQIFLQKSTASLTSTADLVHDSAHDYQQHLLMASHEHQFISVNTTATKSEFEDSYESGRENPNKRKMLSHDFPHEDRMQGKEVFNFIVRSWPGKLF
jgi:hypothetical protein